MRNTLPKSGTFLLGHPVYTKKRGVGWVGGMAFTCSAFVKS